VPLLLRSAACRSVALAGLLLPAPAFAQSADQELIALTTSNRLVRLSTVDTCATEPAVEVTGLQADESLLGIDMRPATGELYGLGSSSRLYRIDPFTGQATAVGAAPFVIALSGTAFGFDFNPTVDRIRIVSNAGQNLRAHPDLGTVVDFDAMAPGVQPDGSLAYDATTADGDPVDANAGAPPLAVSAAYTNPDNDPATGTTLYVIDADLNALAIQAPPNNGVLNTVGTLGANTTQLAGFDIATTNQAFAALKLVGADHVKGCGNSALVSIDLATGATSVIGVIGTPNPIVGLAVDLRN
jgi:Domain of unknown function (DUF4394)